MTIEAAAHEVKRPNEPTLVGHSRLAGQSRESKGLWARSPL